MTALVPDNIAPAYDEEEDNAMQCIHLFAVMGSDIYLMVMYSTVTARCRLRVTAPLQVFKDTLSVRKLIFIPAHASDHWNTFQALQMK